MRRFWAGVVALLAVGVLVAPAVAAAKPPTAMQLVKKLVKAGACDTPAALNASGTIARCVSPTYAIASELEVHAFASKALMLRDLDREIAKTCDAFGAGASTYAKPMFRVGPTWWTHPYRDLDGAAVAAAIGGKVKTYACS